MMYNMKKNHQLLDGLLLVLDVDVHERVGDNFFFFKRIFAVRKMLLEVAQKISKV